VHTTLGFTGDRTAVLDQLSAMGALELAARPRLTLFVGAGAVLGGTVTAGGVEHRMSPGWLATAGASWLAVAETPDRPFVMASFVLGYSAAHTRADDAAPSVAWRALDGRVGLVVGRSFGFARPYLLGRAFGGPVSWELDGQAIHGSDRRHFQLGLGAVFQLPAHVDVNAEVVPLGEQAFALGAGWAF
jgi:hypothetical protein